MSTLRERNSCWVPMWQMAKMLNAVSGGLEFSSTPEVTARSP
jgi:hypothetical protein